MIGQYISGMNRLLYSILLHIFLSHSHPVLSHIFLPPEWYEVSKWAMVTANQSLKAVGLFIAYLLKSITDLFLTKPLWASLKVLEDTEKGPPEEVRIESRTLNVLCPN